jgi:lipoprotein NlpI
MGLGSRVALPVLAMLACAGGALATGIDDANSAVLAARAGKYDEAIRLFTSALNGDDLNLTGRAQAFAYRGVAKAATGDYDGAKEDLNFAVALQSPYDADAYAYRGYFELVLGESAKAAADLGKSADLKIWPYNVLWLSLAREMAHVPDTDNHSLKANAAQLDLAQWPGPVVEYLMGDGTPESVNAAAEQGDPTRVVERVCDADFYVAEQDLAHGEMAAAKPLLQHAADKCPFASFERMGATAELMRLK